MPPVQARSENDGADDATFGAPLQIASMDDSGSKFELNKENLEKILNEPSIADLPAVVVSLAGKTRGGKSFLLNYFVNYLLNEENDGKSPTISDSGEVTDAWLESLTPPANAGFVWQHGDERHTTGIWMYSKPFIRMMPEGKKVAILLVDTQGTFDNKTVAHTNAMVFAMNSLISSMQIYNVSGGLISEDVLNAMHMFTKFGQVAYEKQEASSSAEHIQPFQKMMFLVRDWGAPKNFAFGESGGEGYLAKVLGTASEDSAQELKEVRRDIKHAFSDLNCYLMPNPGDGIMEGADDAQITPRFMAHLNTLCSSILKSDNLVVKQMLGRDVSCCQLMNQIEAYSRHFSTGDMPEVETVFKATAKLNHMILVEASVTAYIKSMDSYAGIKAPYREPDVLEKKHTESMQSAVDMFMESPRLTDAEVERQSTNTLRTKIEEKYAEVCASNESKALLTVLKTPITFGGLALASNIIGTFMSLIGFSSLSTILSYLTWISLLTVAFWAYSTNTGKFGDVCKEVDAQAKVVYDFAMQLAMQYVFGGTVVVAGKKDK